MKNDLRLNAGFPTNRKTRKLIRNCGHEGAWAIVQLWCYAALHHPDDGFLPRFDPEEIEDTVGWTGEPGRLFKVLDELDFLDRVDGGIQIHDWAEHQEFLAGSKARSKQARDAAKVRWKDREPGDDSGGDPPPESPPDAASSADSIAGSKAGAQRTGMPLPTNQPSFPTNQPPPARVFDESGFARFYDAYPIRESPMAARNEWTAVQDELEEIITDVEARVAHPAEWNDMRYVPSMVNYLKGRKWHDEWRKRHEAAPDARPDSVTVNKAARPGETYDQAEARIIRERQAAARDRGGEPVH